MNYEDIVRRYIFHSMKMPKILIPVPGEITYKDKYNPSLSPEVFVLVYRYEGMTNNKEKHIYRFAGAEIR